MPLDAGFIFSSQWRIHDSWTGGADILLPPPAPPLLLSSLLLPLIPPLYFLDVQACRGGWRTPSPHARSAPESTILTSTALGELRVALHLDSSSPPDIDIYLYFSNLF